MMETEFIVLTIALIVSSLACVYCGLRFVFSFVVWKKLRAVRPYIPDNECEIAHKQSYQKTDSNAGSEGVQISPFCISSYNPYNNPYENKEKYSIRYQLVNIFFSHVKRIISKYRKRKQLRISRTRYSISPHTPAKCIVNQSPRISRLKIKENYQDHDFSLIAGLVLVF